MASTKEQGYIPGVVFQPQTYQGMLRGIEKLVNAIRPTLGPLHRTVVIQKESKIGLPELLDNGAVIARRIIQLADRDEDMGAMYLRQLLWAQHEAAGDGTAAAALIFHAIFKEGYKYICAGGNALRLRQALENTIPAILCELERMAFAVEGKEALARLAETICYDPELAGMLGEIFDVLGEYGRLEILPGQGRRLERTYVEGMYWQGGVFSREMIPDPVLGRVRLENAAILASDLEIADPQVMLKILDTAVQAQIKSLLLVARTISEPALALTRIKQNREAIQVVAVKPPGQSIDDYREGLEDLCILTGGRAFYQAAGDRLETLKASDFGFARRAWAEIHSFGIVGGRGDSRRLRQHIADLRQAYQNCRDTALRKRLQERIGKLMGGSAELAVGDATPFAAEMRKTLAERTAEAVRSAMNSGAMNSGAIHSGAIHSGAMQGGLLPGGGVALLACKKHLLEQSRLAEDADERAAFQILAAAVQAPIRALLQNAGEDPTAILAQISAAGPGCGYDVRSRKIVCMQDAGIADPAAVILQAVTRAIHGAALALTVDVLVHRARPPMVYHKT